MQQSRFIFSDERKYRISRHVAFWALWWLFCGIIYAFMPNSLKLGFPKALLVSFTDAIILLPPHIFFAYSLMYFVIPVYVVKNKYIMTALWVLLLIVMTAAIGALITNYVLDAGRKIFLTEALRLKRRPQDSSFFFSLFAGLRGGITIGGLAAAIKLMKYYYKKEQRNIQLQKENLEGQLQLLKAQVHPHFLFNTLNNIYSYTQNTSPDAAKMVTGLSDLLRFILYEGNQRVVPLSRELQMVKDYISLEKIRYGNKLEVYIDLPVKTDELYIAPLLLLPLLENCFKHGASNMLDQPWINLQVTLNQNEMQMKLINGKAIENNKRHKQPGIGIANVEKRLELLYPGKHQFSITSDADVFVVNLKVELERIKDQSLTPVTEQPVVYA